MKDYFHWVLESEEDYDRKSYGKRVYKWMGKAQARPHKLT